MYILSGLVVLFVKIFNKIHTNESKINRWVNFYFEGV